MSWYANQILHDDEVQKFMPAAVDADLTSSFSLGQSACLWLNNDQDASKWIPVPGIIFGITFNATGQVHYDMVVRLAVIPNQPNMWVRLANLRGHMTRDITILPEPDGGLMDVDVATNLAVRSLAEEGSHLSLVPKEPHE